MRSFRSSNLGFTIATPGPPADVRDELRKNLVNWSTVRPAARGIVLGPFVWLWSDLHSNQHAKVIGLLLRDGWGAKLIGTTSHLGTPTAILLGTLAVGFWGMNGLIEGTLYAIGVVPILLVTVILSGLTVSLVWRLDHAQNPTVQMLRDILVHQAARMEDISPQTETGLLTGVAPKLDFERPSETSPIPEAKLIIDGNHSRECVSEATLFDAVQALEDGGFLIISFGESAFMQTALNGQNFVLEYQDEGLERHFQAVQALDRHGVFAALVYYLRTRRAGSELDWKRVSLT